MDFRRTRGVFTRVLLVWAALILASPGVFAQTFRGGINGTVTDVSGAVVPGATVEAVDDATSVSHKTVSSSAGTFTFQDLPLGTYLVSVSAGGFQTAKVEKVPVSAGSIYTLPVKLSVERAATTVEVDAAALSLDTTSTTQVAEVGGEPLQDTPLNGRDFTQLVILTPGFSNSGAGGYGSLNGTRANQINWQIDGIDNNDLWHNIPAVNQGGVSGIAGIILPIDAVDQFSAQTQAAPESGRNPGGSVNLSLKSGGNDLHGSLYYYNRNEFFGATNPFTAPTKQEVRNYNYGFSAGGPFVKDKLFWFTTYEHQRFTIGVPDQATEPTQDWQTEAEAALSKYNIPVNSVSTALLGTLWPAAATGPGTATVSNYTSTTPEYGYSYNGLAKIDYTINDKNSLTAHWFVGQGNQVAPVGSSLYYYYEVAPIHVQNYAIVFNHVFSPTVTNQLLTGVNYFNQVFNDFNTSFDVSSLGLIDGSTLPGSPNIAISGFDPIGETPPEGRNDITGHLTDDLSWTVGPHEFKFGGEFRQAQLDEFYHRHALGSFTFDGTQGPDPNNATLSGDSYDTGDLRIDALADFLAGRVKTSSIALGDPDRQVFVNTFDFFGQDSWQVSKKLNVNYGIRWDYEGPLHNSAKDLSVFRPSLSTANDGIVYQGSQIGTLYDPVYTNFSPRVGFSYQLTPSIVVRAGAGLYFDTPNLNPFLDNRPGNGAPNGVEGNPGGPDPVVTATAGPYTIESGVDPFTSSAPSNSLFSIEKNFVPSHNMNYNLQIEKSFTNKVVAQVGYVGSGGRHLLAIRDINQAALSTTGDGLRPYSSIFPDVTFINEIQSIGTSNYNSLQATIRASGFHGITAQAAYTWSHSLDEVTAYRGALPQDSFNFKGDYGNSDFDNRNIFVGLISYDVPGSSHMPLLTKGWELNSLMTFHGGLPFSVYSSADTSGTNDGNQRANLVPGVNPYTGFRKGGVDANWLNPAAFVDAPAGTWGTTARNEFYGPGYSDVDFSVFKNTKVGERVTTQFRVEMFNLFNRTNYAPPLNGNFNPSYTQDNALSLFTTIGSFNGAPGIGAGEPYNTQFALKVIF
ncbi:MAG TPA: TonB-dependent receptor [Terracidiphilus sp.]|jgi:outer membrane receptor protein involved in Fe transport|nr:TonB-dependent receptor [Terracidiphilus sp.]